MADKPSLLSLRERNRPEPSNARGARGSANPSGDVAFDPFDAFWAAYPRRSGKVAARKSWDKVIKSGAQASAVIAGAARYDEDPNREAEFTKHPATWLNQGCWDDDPLPERHRTGSAANQAHHDDMFAAANRRAAAAEANLPAIGASR